MRNLEASLTQKLKFDESILIVGPADTGKNALLKSLPVYQNALYVDLDDGLLVKEFLTKPEFLDQILNEVAPGEWLAIHRLDRIAKRLPGLINALKVRKIFIAATANSIREFKSADLSNCFQIQQTYNLDFGDINLVTPLNDILAFGSLAKIHSLEKQGDKIRYLKNYLDDFLDLEIISKSLIRNLVPFHLFITLLSEHSSQKINYSSMAQDLDVDYKTVQYYFDLLIDHHLGFYLPAYEASIRKAQSQSAKFYFFDTGFQRAAANKLDTPLIENSPEYNALFKSWCIGEIYKKSKFLDLKISQLETKDGVSVDLIVEKPDGIIFVIVFVTAAKILPKHLKQLNNLGKSFDKVKLFCVSPLPTQDEKIINYKDFFSLFNP